jgi:hypothetical protein
MNASDRKEKKLLDSAVRLESDDPKKPPKYPKEPWSFDFGAVQNGLPTIIGEDRKTVATFKSFGGAMRALACVNLLAGVEAHNLVDLFRYGSTLNGALKRATDMLRREKEQKKWLSRADEQALELLTLLCGQGDVAMLLDQAMQIVQTAETAPKVTTMTDPDDLEIEKIRQLIGAPSNHNFEVAYHRLQYIRANALRDRIRQEIRDTLIGWGGEIKLGLIGELANSEGPVAVVKAEEQPEAKPIEKPKRKSRAKAAVKEEAPTEDPNGHAADTLYTKDNTRVVAAADDGMIVPPDDGYYWAAQKQNGVGHQWIANGARTGYVTDCGKKTQFAPSFSGAESCAICRRAAEARAIIAGAEEGDHGQQEGSDQPTTT